MVDDEANPGDGTLEDGSQETDKDDPLWLRMALADRLRELRMHARISQRKLGPLLGFSRQMIWAWEHGVAPIDPQLAVRWITICHQAIADRAAADATVDRLLGAVLPRKGELSGD